MNDTTTAAMLSEEQITQLWREYEAAQFPDECCSAAEEIIPRLIASHRAQSATIAALTAERDTLRELYRRPFPASNLPILQAALSIFASHVRDDRDDSEALSQLAVDIDAALRTPTSDASEGEAE